MENIITITIANTETNATEVNLQDKIKSLQCLDNKCEKLKKTIQLINALPNDVSRQIFEEHFEATHVCKEFLRLLFEDVRSKRLQHEHLIDITSKLLKYPCAVVYLRKNCKVFDTSYKIHYEENYKKCVLMDKQISFILHILMYLYH